MRKVIIFTALILAISSLAAAADPDSGRGLFNDPRLGLGTSGKTCKTCHVDGLDLDIDLLGKRNFEIMGVMVADVREAVNFCIEVTLRGEGIDPDSKEMQDILAYLEILAREGGGKKYDP